MKLYLHSLIRLYGFFFCVDVLGPLASFLSVLIWNSVSYIQLVGLLWRRISQGRYIHSTTQTQMKGGNPCLEWDSNPRYHCLRRKKIFCALTARHCSHAFRVMVLIKYKDNFMFCLIQFSKPEEKETTIKSVSSLEDTNTSFSINACFLFNIVNIFRNLRWVL